MAEMELEEIDLNEFDDPSFVELPMPSRAARRRATRKPFVLPEENHPPEIKAYIEELKRKRQAPAVIEPQPNIVRGDRGRIQRSETIAATLDIPFGEAYQGEPYYSKSLQSKAPDLFSEAGTSFMRGVGGAYAAWGQALGYLGAPDFGQTYIDFGKSLQKAYLPKLKAPETSWSNLSNPEWWATTVAESLPTSLSLIPPAIIGAYASVATGGAAAPALGAFGKAVLGALGATAVSRPIESAMEAAQTKQDALSRGMSESDAQQAADRVFRQNLALSGMDAAQIATAFTPLRVLGSHAPKALATRILAATGKVAAGVISEAGEEAIQTAFQQSALEGIGIMDSLRRFNPEMKESSMVGGVFGLGLPIAGSTFNALTERITERMSPGVAETYQTAEQAGVSRGLDPIAAKVEALDTLADTPEGRAHIEKIITELKDIAEGKPIEPITTDDMQADIDKFTGEKPFVMGQVEEGIDIASDEIIESIAKGESSIDEMLGIEPEAKQEFFISEETYQAALKSLKEKSSGFHANLDPFVLGDLVKIGAYHLERGVRTFAEWSKLMLERFGKMIEPHLQDIWQQSNSMVSRKIPSGVDLGEEQLKAVKGIEAEDKTLPAKAVKPSVRRITGQGNLSKLIREDVALRAAMKKAEQAARAAYAAGNKDAMAAAKADLRDVLIKAKVKAEAFGFREGFKVAEKLTRKELVQAFNEEQEAMDDTRKALVKIIQEELPPEMRGKYLDAIISKLTERKQNNLLDRIAAMKDTLTKKELIAELADLQKMRGNINVEYQKQIAELIGDIDTKNISAKTRERVERLLKFAEEEGMPSGVSRKTLALIERLQGRRAEDMTIDELKELTDLARHLTEMGKYKQRLINKYNERERQKNLKALLETTHSIDPKTSGKDTTGDKFKLGALSLYINGLNSVRVAEMIDGFRDGVNGKLVRELFHSELAAVWDIRTTIDKAITEALEVGITELTEEQEGRMMVNIRNMEGAENATLMLMEKYGYQEIPELTDKERALIAILKKYSSDTFGDQIAAAFEEMTGMPFPKLEGRILPLKYEGEPKKAPEEVILHTPYRVTSTDRGFTMERQPDVKKMPRTDIWGIFEEGINEQLWFLHMQPALDNVKQLVKSKEYIEKAGELASNWWKDHLDIVGRRGWSSTATHGPFQQLLKTARNNMNQAILGYRLSTIFVQPFAVFEAMAHAEGKWGAAAARKVFSEFAKSWVVPGYAQAYIDNDATHALAIREAGEVAIEEAMYKIGRHGELKTEGHGPVAWFLRNSLKGIQKTDLRTAAGVQQAMEKVLLDHGATEAEAKREAAVMMDMSQSSSDASMRPHILASGEGARTILTFQTFALNQWGLIAHDLVNKGLTKGEAAGRMSAIAGLGLIVMSTVALGEAREYLWELIHRRKMPDRSLTQDALYALPSSIPVFGSVFSAARGRRSIDVPLTKVISDVLAPAQQPDSVKAWLKAIEGGISVGMGIPGTSQAFDFLDGMLFPEEDKKKIKATPVKRSK